MNYGFNLLFGFPVYRTKINSDEYNKQNIVETILENFNKKKERNAWSIDSWGTKIHQSLHRRLLPCHQLCLIRISQPFCQMGPRIDLQFPRQLALVFLQNTSLERKHTVVSFHILHLIINFA